MNLREENCVPCRAGEKPLAGDDLEPFLRRFPAWTVREEDGVPRLAKVFKFPDYASALAFADKVGAEADRQDHHPAILVEWGRTTVSWWTHRIKGLHRNDFVCAARTDALFEAFSAGPRGAGPV